MNQTNITASIKWFKIDKGYGFVRFIDGSGEAFLHSSVLAPLGNVSLTEGTVIVCDVAEGQRGPQVAAIHSVAEPPASEAQPPQRGRRGRKAEFGNTDNGTAMAMPHSAQRRGTSQRQSTPSPAAASPLTLGTVRWYNVHSQSGLIDPHDGGEGIYFDRTILRQSGLDIVADGEDVWFTALETADGPVADRVELAQCCTE